MVFTGWYFAYFDEAVPAFLGHRGLDYPELIASGYDIMLVHIEVDWLGSLRWPDRADVLVSLAAIGRTSLVDPQTHQPREVPDFARTALGEPRPMRQD